MLSKELFMEKALDEAKKTNADSIPIGCILVDSKTGNIVSRTNNNSDQKRDPFSHAEIKALKEAADKLGHNYLNDMEIYVTIEPCLTCFSLIKSYGIKKVFFGAENKKYGFSNFINNETSFSKIKVTKNIKSKEATILLQEFFKKLREKEKNKYE